MTCDLLYFSFLLRLHEFQSVEKKFFITATARINYLNKKGGGEGGKKEGETEQFLLKAFPL